LKKQCIGLRWLDRCLKAHKRPKDQNIFPIVQGGLDPELREKCLKEMLKRNVPGYAIGGLSGGEEKDKFWRIVNQCTDSLPFNKPRYLMGVGYAVDLVVCTAIGVDMFDCVYPARTARFGTALVTEGQLHLNKDIFAHDFRPIDSSCNCYVCKNYTRAYLHSIATKEAVGSSLITYHNIAYQMQLMGDMRQSLINNEFPSFVQNFMNHQFPQHDYPQWIRDALATVQILL